MEQLVHQNNYYFVSSISRQNVSNNRTLPRYCLQQRQGAVIILFAQFICTNFLHGAPGLCFSCYPNENCTNLCGIISEAKLTFVMALKVRELTWDRIVAQSGKQFTR